MVTTGMPIPRSIGAARVRPQPLTSGCGGPQTVCPGAQRAAGLSPLTDLLQICSWIVPDEFRPLKARDRQQGHEIIEVYWFLVVPEGMPADEEGSLRNQGVRRGPLTKSLMALVTAFAWDRIG